MKYEHEVELRFMILSNLRKYTADWKLACLDQTILRVSDERMQYELKYGVEKVQKGFGIYDWFLIYSITMGDEETMIYRSLPRMQEFKMPKS